MSIAVGSVHVDVVPSTKDFVKKMKSDLLGQLDELGREIGERIGGEAARALGDDIARGVEDGVDDADTSGRAAKKGKETGGAFAKALKAELRAALAQLPDVELDVDIDSEEVGARIGQIREELKSLIDKKIGVDLTAGEALTEIQAIKAELQSLRDEHIDIDVDYDLDAAATRLGELERKIAQDAGGSFDTTLRNALRNAVSSLPEIRLDADSTDAVRELANLKVALEGFSALADIDLDINGADALADVERISAGLKAIVDDQTIDIKVRADAAAALGQLETVTALRDRLDGSTADVEVEVHTPNPGAFRAKLLSDIESAARALPEIELTANATLDEKKVQKLRTQLNKLAEDVRLGLDDDAALAKLRRFATELATLSNRHVGLELDTDIDAALAKLRGALEVEGARDGGAFGAAFRRTLAAALDNLPNIDVNADTGSAQAALQQVRVQLQSLSNKRLGIDIDAAQAIAKAEALQGLLAAIGRNATTLDVKMNSAAAEAELQAFIDKARGEVEVDVNPDTSNAAREIGNFARTIKSELEAAVRSIPDLELDTTSARAGLESLRQEIAAFRDLEINVDLDEATALAGAQRLLAQLQAIAAEGATVEIRDNAAAAAARIEAVIGKLRPEVEVEVSTRNEGAFVAKLRAQLAAAQAALPDIDVAIDAQTAQGEIARIRRDLSQLNARIGVDLDAVQAQAEMEAIRQRILILSQQRVDIQVDADVASALAALAAVEAASNNVGGAIARWRLILAAVVALFPLIAGAVIALPGLIAAVATPVAAIALGFEGIKAAVAPLAPLFQQLKKDVSDVFAQGLQPTIAGISKLFPTLNAGLVETAQALVQVANHITTVATSGDNLKTIGTNFDLINKAVAASGPSLSLLTENLITLVNIGAEGLVTFTAQMTAVGETWKSVLADLQSTGVGVAAVEALFSVLSSLLGLLAPLTQFGAILLASFGPAIAGGINALAGAFTLLNSVVGGVLGFLGGLPGVLGALGGAAGAASVAVAAFIAVLAILGKLPATITAQFAAMRAGLALMAGSFTATGAGATAAIAGIRGFAAALGALLVNPVVLIVAGLTAAFYLLSAAQNDAAQAAANHASYLSGLTGQLQQTNGVVTAGAREWIVQSDAYKTAAAGAKVAGVDLGSLTDAVTGNEDALARTRAELERGIRAHKEFGADVFNNREAVDYLNIELDDQGEVLRDSLISLNSMAGAYKDAKTQIAEMSTALREGGISTVGGVASAAAYKAAIKTLGDEMASTSDKAKALLAAIQLLSGGSIGFEQAQANLRETIRGMGEAFKNAATEAKKLGQSITDNTGAINTNTPAGKKLLDQTIELQANMATAATEAFNAAGGMSNVGTASAAASAQVESSRTAFINAAQAAGISATAAADLADRYGLIPSLVTTLLQAQGIPQVNQDLLKINQLLTQIPAGKSVNVGVIAPQALAILKEIGFAVEVLPNGEVIVTATDKTKETLGNVTRTISNLPKAEIPVGVNPLPLQNEMPGVTSSITNAPTANLPVGTNPAPLQSSIPGLIGDVGAAGPAQLPVTSKDDLARAGVAALVQAIGGQTGTLQLDANPNLATGKITGTVQLANGQTAIITLDARPDPATGKINATVDLGNGKTAIMQLDANPNPATGKIEATVNLGNGQTATIILDGNPNPATGQIDGVIRYGNGQTANIKVAAPNVGAVSAAIDAAARNRTATITIITEGANTPRQVAGVRPNAIGNFLMPMAAGGNLSKINNTMAQFVAPNTWRVIGDRMDKPEAYIPVVPRSARSHAILDQTAAAMGRTILPQGMAQGGILSPTEIQQLNAQLGQSFTASGVTPAGGAQAPKDSTELAQKFDKLITLLEKSTGPASITVEDRSGNPVETARATQLALRLAR